MKPLDNIMGLDQSYTGFGYSIQCEGCDLLTSKKAFPLSKFGGQGERLLYIENWFGQLVDANFPTMILMEGYANAVKFGREMSGELGGVVKKVSYQFLGREPIIVPPTTLKKFVTGTGNAPKNVMLQQVYKRWGAEFSDDNMADAFSLRMFGRVLRGMEIGHMTKPMMDAVIKFKAENPGSIEV